MGEERRVQDFGEKNMRERDHWGDPGVDGRRMLGCTFRKWGYGLDWAGSG
jgi:hypothetical protein